MFYDVLFWVEGIFMDEILLMDQVFWIPLMLLPAKRRIWIELKEEGETHCSKTIPTWGQSQCASKHYTNLFRFFKSNQFLIIYHLLTHGHHSELHPREHWVCLRHNLNMDFEHTTLKMLICIHSPSVTLSMLSLFACWGSLLWSLSFRISRDCIYFKGDKHTVSLTPAWHSSLPLLSHLQQAVPCTTLCPKICSAQPSTWYVAKMGFVHIKLNSAAHLGVRGGRASWEPVPWCWKCAIRQELENDFMFAVPDFI